ncbi:hypothetical protein [Phenylobacterium sp.]|uniref:hypothetical protein n=1 Tax=Phenylobacterium sp. TaxID=1871053 RepID=UPI00391CCC52
MTDILLNVRCDGDFWVVECLDGLEPLQFASSEEAEDRARLLARCLTEAGVDVRVLVQSRAAQLEARPPA